MSTIELYGCRGCGSAVVEALLERAGRRVRVSRGEALREGPATDEALKAINPLTQVPTRSSFADGTRQ